MSVTIVVLASSIIVSSYPRRKLDLVGLSVLFKNALVK